MTPHPLHYCCRCGEPLWANGREFFGRWYCRHCLDDEKREKAE
jgi:ribosomal protein L37AE/L43A